jgi:hypothetical protein
MLSFYYMICSYDLLLDNALLLLDNALLLFP